MSQLSGKKVIQLPEEVVNYVQALDFEASGLRVLHTHAMGAGLPQEKVEDIRKCCMDKFAEFQLAKQEILKEFGGGRPVDQWSIDYLEGVLILE